MPRHKCPPNRGIVQARPLYCLSTNGHATHATRRSSQQPHASRGAPPPGGTPRRTLLKDENHTPTHIRQRWGAGRRLRDRWKAIASTHMDRPSASSAEVCKRVPAHCAANLTLHATSQGGWHEPQYCVRGRGGRVRGGGSAWGLGVECDANCVLAMCRCCCRLTLCVCLAHGSGLACAELLGDGPDVAAV